MWPGYAGTTMNLKIFLKENLNNQYLNQATQKKPGMKNFKPKKSFNHPCHLKSRVPLPEYSLKSHDLLLVHFFKISFC